MQDILSAFYLVGHGPRREPRFVELQHERIIRYRTLSRSPFEDRRHPPALFTDLNRNRQDLTTLLNQPLSALAALLDAVKAKTIGLVYLDLRLKDAPQNYFYSIINLLTEAGAQVINVFEDDEQILETAVNKLFGVEELDEVIDDASDFVNFFPRATYELCWAALGSPMELHKALSCTCGKFLNNMQSHAKRNPYALGGPPLVNCLVADRLKNKRWEQNRNR